MPRGSDFEARWSEGAWAELKILEAVNAEPGLVAVQYGITDGTAFWSAADMAARDLPDQSEHGKRPDVLVFKRSALSDREIEIAQRLVLMSDADAEPLTRRALVALECEFSPYAYRHRLDQYGKELSFTIKDEDLQPLIAWYQHLEVPLAIVQAYLDSTYFLMFDSLLAGIKSGIIRKQRERAYDKEVYYPRMSTGAIFAEFVEQPTIGAEVILDKYGKYTAYRKVTGGRLQIATPFRTILDTSAPLHLANSAMRQLSSP